MSGLLRRLCIRLLGMGNAFLFSVPFPYFPVVLITEDQVATELRRCLALVLSVGALVLKPKRVGNRLIWRLSLSFTLYGL